MQDLSNYSLDVIAPVLEAIGLETPEDYKQLWPAVGVFLGAIRGYIRASRSVQTSGDRWNAHVEEFHKLPPAPLDSELEARISQLNEKFSMEKPKVIDTTPHFLACPQCSFPHAVSHNIRIWTSSELREHADTLDELRAIADRNRAMDKLPLAEVVNG